jgi:hypothetical protein
VAGFAVRERGFFSPKLPDRIRGPKYLILNAKERAFLSAKGQRFEYDNLPPSSAEVEIYGSIPPLPHKPSVCAE